jgi:ATP-dependent Lon protease
VCRREGVAALADEIESQNESVPIPEELAILTLPDLVVYPFMVVPIQIGRKKSVQLIEQALVGDRIVGLILQRNPETPDPGTEDLYRFGCAAQVLKMVRLAEDTLRILVQGLARFEVEEWLGTEPFIRARIRTVESIEAQGVELEAMVSNVRGLFDQVVELSANLPGELATVALNIDDGGRLADFVASNVKLPAAERQRILETTDVIERMRHVHVLLNRELEVLMLGNKIQTQVKEVMDKSHREYVLREQLKAIQKELGEGEGQDREIAELRERIARAPMTDEAREAADKQLKRLEMMSPAAADYAVTRSYLDWLLELPWKTYTAESLDLEEARRILDEDHYGLEKIKTRILEFLAVRKLKADMRGPILCFAGPPGVGKTSLGRSIARAMDRKFFRMSLGGMRDEAEIRGHRRTYIGALPGRILQGLKKCGSSNPVFMLDEIDKVGADYRGDPSAALLEVLDPEQNFSFTDHYLEVPYDLSKVLWLTTANLLDTIPGPLRDRMEVIELPGYTDEEKLQIARKYLIPKQLKEHGIGPEHLEIGDEAIRRVIHDYTREAGVRNLERELGALARRVAKEVASGRTGKAVADQALIQDVLGPKKFFQEVKERTSRSGVATGLAWTAVGGDILFIEATKMPGTGKLVLTGKLGEVMKESAQAALSYVKANAEALGVRQEAWEKMDLHIHIPAGAVPKDGPSAGVTMFTALVSLLKDRPVLHDVAMTGEITLRGAVLPVGGIKEKVLAAKRAGITRVVLPKHNEKDLVEIPPNFKEGMSFEFVDEMAKLLPLVLTDRRSPIELQEEARPEAASLAATPAAGG